MCVQLKHVVLMLIDIIIIVIVHLGMKITRGDLVYMCPLS